jgi:hypothetical protein
LTSSEAKDYTTSRRAICQLAPNGAADKPTLSVGEIETVLPPDNPKGWALIREVAETGTVKELDELSGTIKAAVAFMRVHNIGSNRAITM